MNELFKIINILFLFLCFVSVSYSAELTLANALQLAISNNELINASAKSKEFAQYQLKSAKGKNYPNVFLEGSVNKINDPIILRLADARSAVIGASAATLKATGASDAMVAAFTKKLNSSIPDFDMKFQDDLFYKLSAGVVWPLYTGGKISANSKAKQTEVDISVIEQEKTLNSTITSVIESYFKAELAQEVLNIRLNYLNNIKQHAANAEKLFNVGMIAKTNKLRADVALSQATIEYEKSARDFQLALVVLSNIIGKDCQNASLSTDINILENLKDVEYYIETAKNNNTVLKELNEKKNLIKQKKKAITGNFLPTIAAFGKYEIYKEDSTVFDPEWVAGINARLDIFNGGSDYNEKKAYSAQLEVIDLYIKNTDKMITTGIKKYHHEVETAKQRYESLKSSQELTEENLKLYKQSFKEGLATSIEVIDAELAVSKVMLEQLQALYEYNVAYAKLIDICGKSALLMNNITGDLKNEK